MAEKEKATIYQKVTDHILEAMAANPAAEWVMPWHVPTCSALPMNASTGLHYRGVNTLSLWCEAAMKGYETPYWATYRQWKELGAQVRKGEKATPVVFWKIDGGPEKEEAEEADQDQEKTRRRVIARGYSVFSADQVDGWQAPELGKRPAQGRIPEAETFLFNLGADIRHGGGQAYYRPDGDHIQMPRFEHFRTPIDYYSTLSHELGHWSGAKHRLARDLAPRFREDAYSAEELVAELTAAFQLAKLGLCSTPRPDHAPYIAHYYRILGQDPKAIFTAAAKAQQAVDFLEREHERLVVMERSEQQKEQMPRTTRQRDVGTSADFWLTQTTGGVKWAIWPLSNAAVSFAWYEWRERADDWHEGVYFFDRYEGAAAFAELLEKEDFTVERQSRKQMPAMELQDEKHGSNPEKDPANEGDTEEPSKEHLSTTSSDLATNRTSLPTPTQEHTTGQVQTGQGHRPVLGHEHREALRAVLDYLWEAESEDHTANPAPDHIFPKLVLLRELYGSKHEGDGKSEVRSDTAVGDLSQGTETRRERSMSKRNLEQLEKLLAGKDHRRIENPPYMPLVVERLEGQPIISLCHYGEQNGDLMRDPEICFLVADGTAKPVYFRNDFVAVEHATIAGHFGDVPVKPQRQKDLNHFASMWFGNLRQQGFFERARERSEQQAAEAEVASGQNEASNTRERGETMAEQEQEKHETEKQQNGRESIATMELGHLRGEVYRRGEYYSVAVRRPFVGKDGNERLAFDTREQDIRDHVAMLQESEKIIHQDRLERAEENGQTQENRIRITRA